MKKALFGLLFLVFSLSSQADPASIDDARVASTKFLALVDEREYDKSYATASSVLRQEVSQEDWVAHVSNSRAPLGKLNQRTESLSEFHESLPDAPPGGYVIFTYDSSFENIKYATEIVAVAKGADGMWRVVGYYFE